MKIPDEIIPSAYSIAKKVYENKLTQKESKDYLSNHFKVTYGSTEDCTEKIVNVHHLHF